MKKLLLAPLLLVGCQLERFAPDQVGMGVARLSARNAGAVLSLINADATCGFESPGVKGAPRINGPQGGEAAG